MRAFAVSLVVIVVAAGCNLLFPFAPDQACETSVRAQCHFTYACCTATERDTFARSLDTLGFRNEGECVDELLKNGTAECGNALAVQEASQENRFTYDTALAQKCLQPTIDALNQCNTDALSNPAKAAADDPCANLGFADGNFAFGKGKVKADKECFQDFECVDPGSVCEVKVDDNVADGNVVVTSVGLCKAPAKEGEDCSAAGSNGACEPGTFCNQDSVCAKIVLLQNGQDCVDDAQCDSDFCDDVTGGIGGQTCADKLKVGDDCADANDCETGDCFFDQQAATSTCQEPPKLVVDACNGVQADDTKFAAAK